MLQSIKTYLLIAIASLVLVLGGYGYYAHGRIETLTQDVSTYQAAALEAQKAKDDSDKSCVVTTDSLNGYYKSWDDLRTAQQATNATLARLSTLTLKEKSDEAPTKPQSYSDGERLSPDLMRLLDQAYCDGNKDDCATPAK